MKIKQRIALFLINALLCAAVLLITCFCMSDWGTLVNAVFYTLAGVGFIFGLVTFLIEKDAILTSALILSICIAISAVVLCVCKNGPEGCKHDGLTKIAAVSATCTENGHVEYWHCNECSKNFADADGTTELNSVTVPSVGHKTAKIDAVSATCTENGNVEYWHCDVCDTYFSDSTLTVETTEADVTIAVNPDNHEYSIDYDYDGMKYVLTCALNVNHTAEQEAGTEEYPYLANTQDTLKAALSAGGQIKLTDDVTLESAITISKDATIDLNGKTLTQNTTGAYTVSAGTTFNILNGTYELNTTSLNSSVYAINVYGTMSLSNVEFNSYLISTRTSKSQTFYGVRSYNSEAVIELKNSTYISAVKSKVNESCEISTYGLYANSGKITVNGGSVTTGTALYSAAEIVAENCTINAATGVYFGSNTGKVTLVEANINYTECGVNMRYGGDVTIEEGVTFSGAAEMPTIIFGLTKNPTLNDSYNWEFDKTIADCGSSDPIIECYKAGDLIKHVYTADYPQHSYDNPVIDGSMYTATCSHCGYVAYEFIGSSEVFYSPVTSEADLINATNEGHRYLKLENDITITQLKEFILQENGLLDLNEHTITVKGNVYFQLQAYAGEAATIKNGKILRATGLDCSYALKIIDVWGGEIIVEDIELDAGINVSNNATATVKNCKITLSGTQSYYQVCAQANSKVTVENCTMVRTNAGKRNNYFWVESGSSMSVKGCTFESNCGTTYYNTSGVAPTIED